MSSSVLQDVVDTIHSEFSGGADAEQITRVVLRLLTAALLGWEREHQGQPAGVRTHMLVAMGAALFVLASQQMGMQADDLSRVIQGVTAGVGFLCAGTILKGDKPGDVKGLTTAAGIWLTAAIGVAAGLGREFTALLGTLLALAVLSLVPLVLGLFGEQKAAK